MVRFVFISDTHNLHDMVELPEGDILVHSGDALMHGNAEEFFKFAEWFTSVKGFKHKIYVPGNHDEFVEKAFHVASAAFDLPDCSMLINKAITVDNLIIYGAPWTPHLSNWAFCPGDAIAHEWKKIPTHLDLLITHTPPYWILDCPEPIRGKPLWGCKELLEATQAKAIRYHAFGHIHGSYGTTTQRGRTYINSCICTENYRPLNKPIVMDIEPI